MRQPEHAPGTTEHRRRVRPRARFTPGAAITLPGRQVAYTLELSNNGTREATYVATIESPVLGDTIVVTETVALGQVVSIPVPVTTSAVGLATLTADVSAIGLEGLVPFVHARTTTSLSVVDALVKLTEVKATPDFVETGHNATGLSMHVANIAN